MRISKLLVLLALTETMKATCNLPSGDKVASLCSPTFNIGDVTTTSTTINFSGAHTKALRTEVWIDGVKLAVFRNATYDSKQFIVSPGTHKFAYHVVWDSTAGNTSKIITTINAK